MVKAMTNSRHFQIDGEKRREGLEKAACLNDDGHLQAKDGDGNPSAAQLNLAVVKLTWGLKRTRFC